MGENYISIGEAPYLKMLSDIEDYAIILLDNDGNIVHWNKGAEKIKGYTAKEILGRNFRIFYTKEDQDNKLPEQLLAEAIEHGKAQSEGWRVRKDGFVFWGMVLITALHDEDGNLTGFGKITRDLTERKEKEESEKRFIREKEARAEEMNALLSKLLHDKVKEIADYKFALDQSAIVAVTDSKGIIQRVNDNFCNISKYSAEELIGQDHRIINSGYHPKEFIRNLWATIAKGVIWKGELKNKAKDGTIYWVDTTIVPFLDEKGKPYQYIAIRSDITERKVAEENLQKSLREVSGYKFALEESSIVAITDPKGIIQYANDNFCKISKYSRKELVGQDHRIVNSGYHPKEFIHNLWKTISSGNIWKGEIKNKAKDGTIYWVDTTIVPFPDEKGRPYQYLAIRSDITERKNAEMEIITLNDSLEKKVDERTVQLEVANKELEAFSYSVSHDLRAPLRAVNGYGRMLEEDYAPILDDEGKRLLGEVQINAKKMGILIDELLEFSKLGRKQVKRSMIDMTQLVDNALSELNRTIEHKAEVKIHELHPVMADQHLMSHVFSNLLSNAIKYSSKTEKPVVEISSSQEGGQLVYSIKDNGAGFDMLYANKLFGVFQRLHDSDEYEGTGVGLAIVQRIINKHGGRVWAEGKVGEGATFYFSLPN